MYKQNDIHIIIHFKVIYLERGDIYETKFPKMIFSGIKFYYTISYNIF